MTDTEGIALRANSATPGPWTMARSLRDSTRIGTDFDGGMEHVEVYNQDRARHRADAEFIAHARTDIPELLARVRELESALWDVLRHPAKGDGIHDDTVAVQAITNARSVLGGTEG